MKIVNLTPHAITAAGQNISASGSIARVTVTRTQRGDIAGIPGFVPKFGPVEGLPEYDPGCVFIVSALVRTHPDCVHRDDVASPSALVRDDKGAIIGCDGLDFNF